MCNGEEMKTKRYKLELISQFSQEIMSTKIKKFSQLSCKFEDKMGKQKGLFSIITNKKVFLCITYELEIWLKQWIIINFNWL